MLRRLTESGRPASSIRFENGHSDSHFSLLPGKLRARNEEPMIVSKRPIVVLTKARSYLVSSCEPAFLEPHLAGNHSKLTVASGSIAGRVAVTRCSLQYASSELFNIRNLEYLDHLNRNLFALSVAKKSRRGIEMNGIPWTPFHYPTRFIGWSAWKDTAVSEESSAPITTLNSCPLPNYIARAGI